MGEAQKVESFGVQLRARVRWRPCEVHQARLLRMDLEAVLGEPIVDHPQDTPGIVLALEQEHGVVRIADELCPPAHVRLHRFLEPTVKDFVEENVGENRTNDTTLRCAAAG